MIGYSENDEEVQMFDTETENVMKFRRDDSEGQNMPVKSGALDPLGRYFAVTYCDG